MAIVINDFAEALVWIWREQKKGNVEFTGKQMMFDNTEDRLNGL